MFQIKEKLKQAWEWTKEKAKRFWKWILIGGIAVAATETIIQPPVDLETQLIQEIDTVQSNYYLQEGQFVHQPKHWDNKLKANITVNEYLKPNGQRGYWIVVENDDYIKSIGYGVDAQMFTYEIIKEKEIATSTPK